VEIGDLVRVKRTTDNRRYLENKLGVVIVVGTWSADINIIGSNWKPRIAKEHLEVINGNR